MSCHACVKLIIPAESIQVLTANKEEDILFFCDWTCVFDYSRAMIKGK